MPLTDADRAILDFERRWWRNAGTKEQAINTQLGMRSTAYWLRLSQLLDEPDAALYAPDLVARLRRVRDGRRAQRRVR